jgi:hypothetical protein
VKVSMSDQDYAALLRAAGWVAEHAGKDAPAYPELDRLIEVVSNIARRRELNEPVEAAGR